MWRQGHSVKLGLVATFPLPLHQFLHHQSVCLDKHKLTESAASSFSTCVISKYFWPFLVFFLVLYWAPTLFRYLCTNSKVRRGLADILVGLLTAQLADSGCRPRLPCTSQRAPRQDCISFSPFKYFYILGANIIPV